MDELRVEEGALAATLLSFGLSGGKPQPSYIDLLPPIESVEGGYELQVLADLQLGLMALDGPVPTREEAFGMER